MSPKRMCDTAAAPAEAEMASLRSQAKALMRAIGYVDAETPHLEREARNAWAKRNQKALTHARSTLVDWLLVRDAVAAMRSAVERYRTAHPDARRECAAEVEHLLDDLDRAGDSVLRLDRTVRELIALGQVPTEQKPATSRPQLLKARLGALLKRPCGHRLALHDT